MLFFLGHLIPSLTAAHRCSQTDAVQGPARVSAPPASWSGYLTVDNRREGEDGKMRGDRYVTVTVTLLKVINSADFMDLLEVVCDCLRKTVARSNINIRRSTSSRTKKSVISSWSEHNGTAAQFLIRRCTWYATETNGN